MKAPLDRDYWKVVWEKFRAGDRNAFETIYTEFVDVLFSYGARITSDRALLQDAVQDLFIHIHSCGADLRKPESLEYFLFKALKRIIIRKLKQKHRFSFSGQMTEQFDLVFSLEETDHEFSDQQMLTLKKELQNLDARKRELLFLKFNSGLTYREMGKLLHLKPDAVKKQIYRLLSFMREKMEKTILDLFLICSKR